jgi:hypothetical protein
LFVGGTSNTYISLYPPTTDVNGAPLPDSSEVEFEIVRYYFPGNSLGTSGWQPATYVGVNMAFGPREQTSTPNRWSISAPFTNLQVTTPVDCLEPRLVVLAARAMLVVPGTPQSAWPRSPWTLSNLSFRYAAQGTPGSTDGCVPMLIRYASADEAATSNGLPPIPPPPGPVTGGTPTVTSPGPSKPKATPTATPTTGSSKPQTGASKSIVILFDASGSMGDDGKIDAAKASVRSVLSQIAADTEVALIVFYDCGSIVVENEFTTATAAILTKVEAITPSGSTPLADAITFAKEYIEKNASSTTARLVILSDGEETCGGDPVSAARP